MCESVSSPDSPQRVQQFQQFISNDELQSEAVLSHVFDVTRHEARTYRALHNRGENTAQELAEILDRHPSNVCEGLSGLSETGLAVRHPRILDHGGQEYVYSAVPVHEAIQIMQDEFEEWVGQMQATLDTLEANCNCAHESV